MNRIPTRARRMGLGVAAILGLVVFPALFLTQLVRTGRSPRLQVRHAREIAEACRAMELPSAELAQAASSTEVFNRLVQNSRVPESHFYVPGFSPLKRRSNGDGVLQPEENCFALMAGLPPQPPPGIPVLLWDPFLEDDSRVRRFPLAPHRWLSVDGSGRATLRTGHRAPPWWRKREESDFLPSVEGVQRLLRP